MNYWYLALIGAGLILLVVFFYKDSILRATRYLGRGEFSEVWFKEENGLVLKKSAFNSLYNPTEKGTKKRNIRVLKEEVKTYNILKKHNYSLLPKKLYSYKERKTGNYVIAKEYGDIPLDPKDNHYLQKWKPGSVSQKHYDQFAKELFEMAKKDGHFEDHIQPAQRKNGELFIVDLGLFEKRNPYQDDFEQLGIYSDLERRLEFLDEQFGIEHKVPGFVIKENLDYYKDRYEKTAMTYHKEIAEKRYGKQIEYWESKKDQGK